MKFAITYITSASMAFRYCVGGSHMKALRQKITVLFINKCLAPPSSPSPHLPPPPKGFFLVIYAFQYAADYFYSMFSEITEEKHTGKHSVLDGIM